MTRTRLAVIVFFLGVVAAFQRGKAERGGAPYRVYFAPGIPLALSLEPA